MITTIFFYLIAGILKFGTLVTGSWAIPDSVESGFHYFYDNMMLWNNYLPVLHGVICVSIVVGFRLILLTTKAGIFLITLLRGGGGSID